MTALNFPSSPTYGQIYNSIYKWDGEKWIPSLTGIGMPNPPTSPRTAIISPAWCGLGGSIFYDSGAGVTQLV